MATNRKPATIVTTKGNVALPETIRRRHGWIAGTRLIVEDVVDGAFLRAVPVFAPSDPKDVFGSLKVRGRAKTLKQMKVGTKSRRS